MREAAGEIEAVALVPAAPEDVFAFLSELANHWLLLDSHVDVVGLEGDRAVVRLRGPLGVRRTVRTRVTVAREPRLIIGIAELGEHTRARVSWTLAGRLGHTRVRLAAEVEHADLLDRIVLALGGRRWLERRFAYGLERLARRFKAAPESKPAQSPPPAERSDPPSPSPPGRAYPSAGGSS